MIEFVPSYPWKRRGQPGHRCTVTVFHRMVACRAPRAVCILQRWLSACLVTEWRLSVCFHLKKQGAYANQTSRSGSLVGERAPRQHCSEWALQAGNSACTLVVWSSEYTFDFYSTFYYILFHFSGQRVCGWVNGRGLDFTYICM